MRQSKTVIMSRFSARLLAVAATALSVSVVARAARPPFHQTAPPAAASSSQAIPQDDATLEKQGETTTDRICTECHPFDDIIVERRTVKGWKDVMVTMTNKGAQANEQQITLIRRYLTRFFGIVGINTASADDLSAVLGLSEKEAAALVEYRTGHGKFADAAALEKVPGLDVQKIKDQLDAIRFD